MLSNCNCFLGVLQSLIGKGERLLVYARLFVGAHQVPIHVFDLGDGGDDLVFEGDIGDLLVVLGDMQIAQVWTETKSREKLLLKTEAVVSSSKPATEK